MGAAPCPLQPSIQASARLASSTAETTLGECPDTQAARALRTAFKLLDTVQGVRGKESAATGTPG